MMEITSAHRAFPYTAVNHLPSLSNQAFVALIWTVAAVAFASLGGALFYSGAFMVFKMGFRSTDALLCMGIGALLIGTVPKWIAKVQKIWYRINIPTKQYSPKNV
ncbi:MAG: hypothetical protein LLG04_12690 [Parachlamydia sp.]|nr:hypothetical protein [Parachlamydia sp.]